MLEPQPCHKEEAPAVQGFTPGPGEAPLLQAASSPQAYREAGSH